MKKIAMILSICCLFSIFGFYNVVFADQDVQVIVNDHPIAVSYTHLDVYKRQFLRRLKIRKRSLIAVRWK